MHRTECAISSQSRSKLRKVCPAERPARIEENAVMAAARRVRLDWDDGTVEAPHQPIDAAVTMIVRRAKGGTHRHFAVTDDI